MCMAKLFFLVANVITSQILFLKMKIFLFILSSQPHQTRQYKYSIPFQKYVMFLNTQHIL